MTSGSYRVTSVETANVNAFVSPSALSNAQIDAALDTLYRAQIRLQNRFIALGRGMEKPQIHGRGDDAADVAWRDNAYRIDELENVLKRRSSWQKRKMVCGTAT